MIPLLTTWTGTGFEVAPRHRKQADAEFVIGERYVVDVQQERSAKTHSHYFAALTEAWRNLGEDQAERFATVEHLRKFSLIKCGFYDERSIVCASKAEALRIASFIKPLDGFAIVTAKESVVRVYTAKSQSMRAMGKAEFGRSKTAVLEYVASLIGVAPGALEREGRAA